MSLVLRRMIWPDGKPSMDPEDYRVYDGDRKLGWISRTISTGKPRWEWGIDCEMGKGKQGGPVDSLEEAKAAFRRAWQVSAGTDRGRQSLPAMAAEYFRGQALGPTELEALRRQVSSRRSGAKSRASTRLI